MTIRAIILGLLWGLFIAVAGYVNDQILHLTFMVGNHLPIGVLGPLLLVVMVVHPLLGRFRPSLRLKPAEMAVVLMLALTAASIPGSSGMRSFYATLAMPQHLNRLQPGWQRTKVLEYVPAELMPGDGSVVRYDPLVVDGYLQGLRTGDEPIGIGEVPWHLWQGPLAFWAPVVFLFALAVICLSLIVHSQWARREGLTYPVAGLAQTIIAGPADSGRPLIRSRGFLVGMGVVFLIHVVNGTAAWSPGSIEVPLTFDFSGIAAKWPALTAISGSGALIRPRIFPTVVAFTFFMASDVGFSLGISQYVYAILVGLLITYGVDLRSGYLTGGVTQWQRFGSALGIAAILLYIGRRYYAHVLRRALVPGPKGGRDDRCAVWACRVGILAVIALIVLLCSVGLQLPFAVLTVLLALLVFLVAARVNAESGVFYFQPVWQPYAVLTGLFGAAAMGPQAMVIVGLLCMIVTVDPRECLMPFVVNGLKVCDDARVRLGRTAFVAVVAFAVCLAAALPAVLYLNYDLGLPTWDSWGNQWVPRFTFDAASAAIDDMAIRGELERSVQMNSWQRLAAMQPQPAFLWAAGIGFGLAVALSLLRLRLPRWPLHSVALVMVGTYPGLRFAFSFLLGWAVKSAVVALGGTRKHQRLKPLMIGLIVGDLMGGLLWMIVGVVYYLCTGKTGPFYRVFPG